MKLKRSTLYDQLKKHKIAITKKGNRSYLKEADLKQLQKLLGQKPATEDTKKPHSSVSADNFALQALTQQLNIKDQQINFKDQQLERRDNQINELQNSHKQVQFMLAGYQQKFGALPSPESKPSNQEARFFEKPVFYLFLFSSLLLAWIFLNYDSFLPLILKILN